MAANSNHQATVRLVGVLALLLVLCLVAGCAERDVTAPSSSRARIYIVDGPEKPMTRIQVVLDVSMTVSLDILDANSGQVRSLYDGVLDVGPRYFAWNGADEENSTVASGPYWAVLSSSEGLEATAMMMVK